MQPRKIFIIFILLHLAISSHGKTSLHTFKRDNSKTETYLQCSSVLSVSSQEECVTTALQSGHRTAIFNEKYSTCSICDERGRQHIVQEGGVKWGRLDSVHNMELVHLDDLFFCVHSLLFIYLATVFGIRNKNNVFNLMYFKIIRTVM